MNINWYPGHMAKTKRLIAENLKMVDVVVELLDARIPISSKNPDIRTLTNGKLHLAVLNKADLADEQANLLWKKYYTQQNTPCIFVNTLKSKGIPEVKTLLGQMLKEKLEMAKRRGRIFRPIRTMVVGIPNVGKSTFINKIAGKAVAITGDMPGVTKNKQWIRINEEIELLDTPGVLWPKFSDEAVGIALAATGAIKDTVFDTVELSIRFIELIQSRYGVPLMERFKLQSIEASGSDILTQMGRNRGCIMAANEIDLYRTAAIVLDEFRAGKIGKITLEWPSSEES